MRQLPFRAWRVTATPEGVLWLAATRELHVSTDGGQSFKQVDYTSVSDGASGSTRTLDEAQIEGIWARGRSLYIATSYQVLLGEGLGARWRRLAGAKLDIRGQAVPAPLTGVWGYRDKLYFIEQIGRLHVSSDDGRTWKVSPRVQRKFQDAFLNITGNGKGRIYVRDAGLSLLSTIDDGKSWTIRESQQTGTRMGHVAAGPEDTVMTVVEGKLWRSLDAGTSWAQVATPLPVRAIASGPLPGDWSATVQGGMLRTLDDGASWSPEDVVAAKGDEAAQAVVAAATFEVRSLWRSACAGYGLFEMDADFGPPDGSSPRTPERTFLVRGACEPKP